MSAPITASLASIAAHWPQLLEDVYAISSGASGSGGSPSRTARLPGGTARLSLIAETRHTLWHWCRIVIDERAGERWPRHPIDGEDVIGMCAWLRPHADWMEGRNAIAMARLEQEADAAQELAELAATLGSLVAPAGIRRPPIGPCQIEGCAGTIRGYIDSACTERADLVCDTEPEHRWHEGRWVDLAGQLGHDHPQRMTSAALAAYLSERFRTAITHRMVWNWGERNPMSVVRRFDGTYDRVAVTEWYMQRLAEKVGA